jgi:hypothetical protein
MRPAARGREAQWIQLRPVVVDRCARLRPLAGRLILFPLSSLLVLAGACAPRLELGSEILWSARHETGDLSEWLVDGKGGSAAEAPDTSIAVSTDFAHSGTHSVKLANGAVSSYESVRLWREDSYPVQAYYSAWYYLPRAYQTTGDWTILQVRNPVAGDPTTISLLLDVDLRSLPGGDLILTIYDHRQAYLRSPTPDPAIVVPVGAWFQIEIFFDNEAGGAGRFSLWLDGQLGYDIQRPFGLDPTVYFSPCSVSEDLSPTASVIYVDDAAVSVAQVTPDGTLPDGTL